MRGCTYKFIGGSAGGGGALGTRPPLGPISSILMQSSTKTLPNNRFSLQNQELALPVWETLDPPLLIHLRLNVFQVEGHCSQRETLGKGRGIYSLPNRQCFLFTLYAV